MVLSVIKEPHPLLCSLCLAEEFIEVIFIANIVKGRGMFQAGL